MIRALSAVALLASPAWAEDCGRLADPLAYNSCLARQGPAARAAHVGAAPHGRDHGVVVRRGRSEMVFSPRR